MNEEETLISGIEYKVRKLISQLKEEKQKKNILSEENNNLKTQLEAKKKVIKELENKINGLTIAELLKTEKGTEEARERINELVREIDHCIGLLNN